MTERCDRCRAEILYGTPRKTRVTMNGIAGTVTQCEECSRYEACALWPEEEWGPYPLAICHKAGNA